MARRYLKQKNTGEIYVWTEQLAKRPDMEEWIKPLPVTNDHSYKPEIQRIQSDVIRFFSSARGLGDAVTALYAACGLADAGHEVEFFTPRKEWLYVNHPGVRIIKGEDGFDANTNYLIQLGETRQSPLTRCDWYLKNIATAYGIEQCKAARPKEIGDFPLVVNGDYVLLCPFSIATSRSWLPAHWRKLAIALQQAGMKPVAIAEDRHRKELSEMFYGLGIEQYVQTSIDTLCGLIQHAQCVVSNDSGPAHLGGLYGKRTIALVAQFRPEYLYDCANNLSAITSDASCNGCHGQEEGGWDQFCHVSCSALQLTSPEQVIKAIFNTEPDIKEMAKVLLRRKPREKETSLGKTQSEKGKQAVVAKAKGISKSQS